MFFRFRSFSVSVSLSASFPVPVFISGSFGFHVSASLCVPGLFLSPFLCHLDLVFFIALTLALSLPASVSVSTPPLCGFLSLCLSLSLCFSVRFCVSFGASGFSLRLSWPLYIPQPSPPASGPHHLLTAAFRQGAAQTAPSGRLGLRGWATVGPPDLTSPSPCPRPTSPIFPTSSRLCVSRSDSAPLSLPGGSRSSPPPPTSSQSLHCLGELVRPPCV